MKLLIVSGLSGSGKSIVLDTLEDSGYYCVDNLPLILLDHFVNDVMLFDRIKCEKTAIGIDVRNQSNSLSSFPKELEVIRGKGIDCEIIFLQAEQSVLIKRYSETRRKHPLTNPEIALTEALKIELDVLKPVVEHANVIFDTSQTHLYQLRELINRHIGNGGEEQLSLQFQSFGYKYGIPLDADFVFDARCLPNPYWDSELRVYTGRDVPIIQFLNKSEYALVFFQDICEFIDKWLPRFEDGNRSYLTIAVGCTGGRHRSVYLVELLVRYFKKNTLNVIARHRELH